MTRSQITPHSVRPEHENDLMEAAVDCKHGILTGVDVYSANEKVQGDGEAEMSRMYVHK